MLTITDKAKAAIANVIENAGKPIAGLRIQVSSGGCSGLQYALSLEAFAPDGDDVVALGGLDIFVPPTSALYLTGVTVDFAETVEGAGFTFDNPNAKSSCGCGKSFC
ncbi:MAG: iron-sulfur cluster assembly accessory protein [Alphaproteobacteria bacterium]|nr:iron-sulfur cluster assembly accessory protein [Alphaproteobacteria bacterium]MBF0249408.1 iron-sulfur cluster assembly accessory protein [Alphaproteobacteria bacterium]